MRPALRKAGIPDSFRPFHDLRHTALTVSAAVNPGHVVKAQAGHASSATTDRYVRLAVGHLAGAAGRKRAGSPSPERPLERERPRFAGPLRVAGAGFEPATSGL